MTPLRGAPNLGSVLAGELTAAGIGSLEELRRQGAIAAWELIRRVNPERDCASSLCALEGAVRGIRWFALPPAERRRLSEYAAERRLGC